MMATQFDKDGVPASSELR